MATTSSVLPPLPSSTPLTLLDRCDRCSAAAQLRAVLPAGELLFCGHHAREHRARLIDIGARLTPDPAASQAAGLTTSQPWPAI